MAGENNHATNCLDDPNFATICSFIEKFGEICHIGVIPFQDLQEMLENTSEVPLPLVELHIRLLRRVYKSINTNKWEKSISKFAHSFSNQDGWEIERCGYKKTKIQTKLRVLKNLLESQFDFNTKFKGEVNKLPASDLRLMPLGRDVEGHAYWYQVDLDANLRVYREDIDEETWEIVASSQEEMETLITQLRTGEVGTLKRADRDENILEEDTNGFDGMDIDAKDGISVTGQVLSDPIDDGADSDSDAALHIKEEDESCDSATLHNHLTKSNSESVPAPAVTNQGITEPAIFCSNAMPVVEKVKTSAVKSEHLITDIKPLEVPKVTPASVPNTNANDAFHHEDTERPFVAVPVTKIEVPSKEFTNQLEKNVVAAKESSSPKELNITDDTKVVDSKSISQNDVPSCVSAEDFKNPVAASSKISDHESKTYEQPKPHLSEVAPTAIASHNKSDDLVKPEITRFPAVKIPSAESEIPAKSTHAKETASRRSNKVSKVSVEKNNQIVPPTLASTHVNVQEPKHEAVEHNTFAIHNIVSSAVKTVEPETSTPNELRISEESVEPTPSKTEGFKIKDDTERENQDKIQVTEDTKNTKSKDTPKKEQSEPMEVDEPPFIKSFAYITGTDTDQNAPEILGSKCKKIISHISRTDGNPQPYGITAVSVEEPDQIASSNNSMVEGSAPRTPDAPSDVSVISPKTDPVKPLPEPEMEPETNSCIPSSSLGENGKNTAALQTKSIKPSGCDQASDELEEVSNSSFQLDSSEISTATDLPIGKPEDTNVSDLKDGKSCIASLSKKDNQSMQPCSSELLPEQTVSGEPSREPKIQNEVVPVPPAESLTKSEKSSELLDPVLARSPKLMDRIEENTLAKSETLLVVSAKTDVGNEDDNIRNISSSISLSKDSENLKNPAIHPVAGDGGLILRQAAVADVTKPIDSSVETNSDLIQVQSVPLESTPNTVAQSNIDNADHMEQASLMNFTQHAPVANVSTLKASDEQDKSHEEAESIVSIDDTPSATSSNGELSEVTTSNSEAAPDIKKEETLIPITLVNNQPAVYLKKEVLGSNSSLMSKVPFESANDSVKSADDPVSPKSKQLSLHASDDTCTSIAKDTVELTSVAKDTVELASVANDTVELTPAAKDTVELATVAKDTVELPSAAKDTVELASVAKDTVELPSAAKDTVELASAAKDTVELPSAAKDTVELASAAKDTVELPSAAKDTVELASVAKDTVELPSAAKDTVELASVAKDTVELASAATDTAELASAAKDTVEPASAAKDTVELASAAKNTVELASTAKNTVELAAAEVNPKVTSQPSKLMGLVGYAYSSSDDDDDIEKESNDTTPFPVLGQKRKLDVTVGNLVEPKEKISKSEDSNPSPIVGEAIEEDLMIVTGSGEGALNEGGNDTLSESELAASQQSLVTSQDVEEAESSQDIPDEEGGGLLPPAKGKGRGRPKKGTAKNGSVKEKTPRSRKKSPDTNFSCRRNSLTDDTNGTPASTGPIRRSGRVAQIRQKEEEERRKLEEERLAQLKEAQVRKQQKQKENESKGIKLSIKSSKVSKKQGIPKQAKSKADKHVTYTPASDESESDSHDDDDDEEDDYEMQLKAPKGRKRRKNKNGKPMKKGNPWMHSSSEEEVADEEEEHYDVEEEEEELVFNNGSDHEFSPESDLEEGTESSPSRHARTAKQKEEAVDKYSETNCDKCKKGDHPEWILLCDECDKGWHASCVIPQLWVIPEGQWFCPPCEHNMLVKKLNENLVEYEKILKRRENDVLRKQRLAYVGISLNNVLPSAEKEEQEEEEEPQRKTKKQRRNRLIYSDEELEEFIDDDDGSGSESGSGSGSYESEDEPMYKLRARRATKAFNFQEYDDMIKSALRDSDAEEDPDSLNRNGDAKATGEVKVAVEPENKDVAEKEEKSVPRRSGKGIDDETDEDELDEKEKSRRKILNQGARKTKRRLNDLSATSEEDSDEDFKGSAEDDDDDEEEENVAEDDSEWSGDGDSDDSIAVSGRRRKQQKLGRRERFADDGTVRRSTRRRKAKIKYDESDQEEDDDDEEGEKWQSGESESSVSESESDDETWGKKKKKKPTPGKSSVPNFFMQVGSIAKKSKPKKKKRRKVDEDEVDRAWSNKFGSKSKKLADEPVERKTRGRKINFKDILDSGESDDDGNIRPKRRRILSDSDEDEDGESPSSSRKLADEIRAENQRLEAEAKEQLKREAKAKELAKLEKTPKKEAAPGSKSKAKTLAFSPIQRAGEMPSLPLQSPILAQELLSGTNDPSKSIKITKSIVESILRKSPGLSDSPPPTSPHMAPTALLGHVPVSIHQPLPESPHLSLAAMNTLSPVYLPTVIPSLPPISGTGPGTGSARVGKKKTASMLSASASSTDVLPFPSSKKSTSPVVTQSSSKPLPPSAALPSIGLPQGVPPNMQELQRLAGAGPMYPGNPALRAFHPAWMRNPPPYAGPPPQSLGKPPPLSNASFVPQSSQLRPTSYGQPQNVRIPSPNQMQAFQHFAKRTADAGVAPYRLPPHHQLPRGAVLMGRERERVFLGGNSPYTPYGILPVHPQGQPSHPSLFGAHFDYRPPEAYKDDSSDRSNQSPRVSQSSPTTSTGSLNSISTTPAPPPPKDDVAGSTQGDGEFGGLVSYFSSQHSNDDD